MNRRTWNRRTWNRRIRRTPQGLVRHPFAAFALFSAALLALESPALATSIWVGDQARLEVADGALHVSLRPDDSRSLPLSPQGPNRWVFQGNTEGLIGEPYSIVLRNDTSERLKVVIGVDGLNVYEREVVGGSAGEDIGSILPPWSERVLPGWQIGNHRAQRFVFSPNEWSEGQGRTESRIGQVLVQVYREWREPQWDERDGGRRRNDGSEKGPGGVAVPRSVPEPAAPDSASGESSARATRPREPIGTTAGDDVSHSVRTVHFAAATSYPETWTVIDYGGQVARAPRWPAEEDLLGLDLAPDRDGARIVGVAPGSAAERAGLEPSDVIVRIDSVHAPTPYVARRVLRAKDRGDYAFLRVRRGPHELAVKVRV